MSFSQSPEYDALRTEALDNAGRARERRLELESEYAGEPAMPWGYVGKDEEFAEVRLERHR